MINLKKDKKRFQECNIFVRLYRRIRYQPYYFIKALWVMFKAVFDKEREFKLSFYFKLIYTQWQSDADWWYTLQELQESMRDKFDIKN
jgi:hypothetical protein